MLIISRNPHRWEFDSQLSAAGSDTQLQISDNPKIFLSYGLVTLLISGSVVTDDSSNFAYYSVLTYGMDL